MKKPLWAFLFAFVFVVKIAHAARAADAAPQVSLHPVRWYFWQTARVDISPAPHAPLRSVTVSVLGPAGYERRWRYGAVRHIDIRWDARWYSNNGEWARPGEYRVVVEAVDVEGHVGSAAGTVIVPRPVPTATPTPTATSTPTPTFTPTPTPTPTPTTTPTPTATSTPKPSMVPPPTVEKPNSVDETLLGIAGGIVVLLVGALASGPRPRSTRNLANALRRVVRYLESKEE